MNNASHQRVVVTGIGSISSLGHDVSTIWDALLSAKSGIQAVTRVDPDKLNVKIAAEIKGYDEKAYFDERELEWLDPFTQYALIAADEALSDAGFELDEEERAERTAIIVASGVGGFDTMDRAYRRLYEDGVPRARPSTIPRLMISAAASQISMKYGIRGPAFCVSSACSSANHAMGEAYWMIRTGRADAAVAGGSEAAITLSSQRAWESLRVMAPDTCRPFSKTRKGMVIGEGAGIVVMERLEDAKKRGARIYGEIVGYGLSADAGDIVMPDQKGAARAIKQAVETAGMNPEEVGYVNAHGTGTLVNDAVETKALKQVFGDHAGKLMISSTKSMHGHALGAAGALEIVATLKALETGVVPPTANYEEPDPECDLDYVPNEAREAKPRAAVSNSFAFGGLNAVLAMRAFD